jgi:glycerol-3-phosphate O-acyltransferase
VKAARTQEKPILLLPDLLVWERNPGRVRPGMLDMIFGSPEAPGTLAQLGSFLRNYSRAYVRLGEPIHLTQFVRERAGESDEDLARKVRGALSQHLARQTRAIVGPPLKEPDRLNEEILRDRTYHRSLEASAAELSRPIASVEAEARKDLDEIGARYSPTAVAVVRPMLSWIFNRIYDGVVVDEVGLKRAMDVGVKGPLIFCPSHKSHIDYMLIAHVFAERGMAPPHAAAGANLSFFPLGTLFRRGGAFFLRRSFKGDKIYTATFRAYVKKLMKEGVSQEFYLEGGRSRTGKLLNPKTGLLSFEVDAFNEGVRDDAFFVPVAIDYEKIVEAGSYERELAGGEKQKEDVKGLLSTRKVLQSSYGRIYISFEKPISLKEFLAARGDGPEADKRKTVAALAHQIIYDISKASVVTPSALLASVLMTNRQRGLSAKTAGERIAFLLELAREGGHRISDVLQGAPSDPSVPGPLHETLKLFEDSRVVSHQDAGGEAIYKVSDDHRREFAFYKNNFMHVVASRSVVACALQSFKGQPASRAELRERAKYLSRLFKLEFIYKVSQSFDANFEEKLGWLTEKGLVLQEGEQVRPATEPVALDRLQLLSELMRDFVESYLLAARVTATLSGGARDRKDLLNEMFSTGQRSFLEGKIHCAEAVSRPNLENALELFTELGHLQAVDKSKLAFTPQGTAAFAGGALEAEITRFL